MTPGFFDMHAHSEFGLSLDGRALSKVTQGVTTEVLGEHLSAGPVLGPAVDDPMMITPPVHRTWTTLGGFFSFLEKKGIGLNVVSYVGAGQVRASVMGYENRTPTPAEMDQMKKLIAQAMEEGAFGLSAGLVYVPNSFDTTEQMIELAKVAASYGGIYSVHMRTGDDKDCWRPSRLPKARIFRSRSSISAGTIAQQSQLRTPDRAGTERRHRCHCQRLSLYRGLDLCAPAYAGLGAGRQCRRHHRAAEAA